MSLFSILCFVLLSSFGVASVSAQRCMNKNGYFKPNGTYDANRRLILSSLPSNVTSKEGLYFNGSVGQEPNRVYAIGMCIPGSTSEDCSVCIKTLSDRLIKNCPNQTNAFHWPGQPTLCHVRYSNTSFLGSADLDPRALLFNKADINSNLTEFTRIWENLVVRMIDAASIAKSTSSSSDNHYKADVAPLTAFQNIYALMQCTPDLSSGDCDHCLRRSAREYQSCCGQKLGGVVMRPSCFFRWDIYRYSKAFDNITVDDQARTTDNDSKGISSGVVAAITVPTVITVFILLILGVVRCLRRKSMHRTEVESDSDISTPHLWQYDLKTIEAATNKFSRSNKLDSEKQGQLDWTQRYKIIGGIARGILYLHQDSQLTVIHRDLKASNILLDANMNPKISGFGLSTIFGMEQTRGNTSRIDGTYGYMSPEYAMHGTYSMKSDIYSFGVLVLEIISGKKNSCVYQMDENSTPGNLITYAWRLWRNGSPLELVDSAIGMNYQSNEVTRCIHIALLCVQENPEDRPMLSTIILMLTSNTFTLPVPRIPSFIPRSRHEVDSEGLESSQFTGRSIGYSVNNVS
ncbi:unnamed protein product [Eruca vesicaria subsp. sativa]|uniref:Uncharacterized protein n=1 Tax=Eruca vesicaria subsp. sativa TaxID=29727 RepID=A0ABC8KV55_ERUVS|nr:unnamed protein product [Eruca vesicaria subsp. sativa]